MDKKTIVVTGASSGIGKALAILYAKKEFRVVMAARNMNKLEKIASQLVEYKDNILLVKTDVSKEKDCQNLIQKAAETFGGIDILINNAGISMRALFKDVELEVLKNLMDTNFWGAVYCTKYSLPYLLKSKGSVVGVNSIAGYVGLPARTGYSASKFALRGFLDTLRTENLYTGLHVLNVAPGFTSSNIRNTALAGDGSMQGETPRDEAKMMSSETVAEKIFAAVQKRKKELILTFVEGKLTVFLNKILPRMTEKMVYNHMAKEKDSPLPKKSKNGV